MKDEVRSLEEENPFLKGAQAYWRWRNAEFPDELFYDKTNPYLQQSLEYDQFLVGWDDQDSNNW